MCHSKKIHTHPREGHRKFLGGGEAKCEAKLELPGGGGTKQKIFHGGGGGGMDIFWNCTMH